MCLYLYLYFTYIYTSQAEELETELKASAMRDAVLRADPGPSSQGAVPAPGPSLANPASGQRVLLVDHLADAHAAHEADPVQCLFAAPSMTGFGETDGEIGVGLGVEGDTSLAFLTFFEFRF